MMIDDNDGQMIFGDLGGLKLPDICLTGEEKPRKNLTQETCPDQGSNPGLQHDRCACYHLSHSDGQKGWRMSCDVDKAMEALLILQPFRQFTYITAHSPTLLLLHLCHSSFSNPSLASPTSQAPLMSPGELPMIEPKELFM